MPVGGVRGRGERDCRQISTNSELMMLCIHVRGVYGKGVCVWEGWVWREGVEGCEVHIM